MHTNSTEFYCSKKRVLQWTEAGCGPWPVDRVHGFFLTKIIMKSIIPGSFAMKPLGFSKINPQSMIYS
jgi:hypothetical protein